MPETSIAFQHDGRITERICKTTLSLPSHFRRMQPMPLHRGRTEPALPVRSGARATVLSVKPELQDSNM